MATIKGTTWNDFKLGTSKADLIDGREGNDTLLGLGGNDTIHGGAGSDLLDGGSGNDFLLGGDGDDFVFGGIGDDRLEGGAGNDKIEGGSGNDTMMGHTGSNVLDGGAGNDTFILGGAFDTVVSDANDADVLHLSKTVSFSGRHTMTGFNGAGEAGGDTIQFHHGDHDFWDLIVTERDGKTNFTFHYGNDDWLRGPELQTLTVDTVGLAAGVDYFLIA